MYRPNGYVLQKGEDMNVFIETYRSNAFFPTREDALKVLDEIRREHPEEKGWREIDAGVDQIENGMWYAWRRHEHFR